MSVPQKRKRTNYDISFRKEIIDAYNNGKTPSQLSMIYNVSSSTISGMCSKNNQEKIRNAIETCIYFTFYINAHGEPTIMFESIMI